MIRLGNAILNEDYIAAIRPANFKSFFEQEESVEGVIVHFSSGASLHVNASVVEAGKVLERVGLIEPVEPKVSESVKLLDSEIYDLMAMYYAGFSFVAKDANGKVYAFSSRPTKGKTSWLNDDQNSWVRRLPGEFAALSFEDAEPLDIAAALGLEAES